MVYYIGCCVRLNTEMLKQSCRINVTVTPIFDIFILGVTAGSEYAGVLYKMSKKSENRGRNNSVQSQLRVEKGLKL